MFCAVIALLEGTRGVCDVEHVATRARRVGASGFGGMDGFLRFFGVGRFSCSVTTRGQEHPVRACGWGGSVDKVRGERPGRPTLKGASRSPR